MTSPRTAAVEFYNHAQTLKDSDPQLHYKTLTSAVTVDPTFAEAWLALGNANTGMKLREAAVVNHRRTIEINPTDARAWTNLGHQLYFLGHHKEARLATRRAIELAPDHPHGWCNLSLIQSVECQLEAALESAKKAYAMDPSQPDLEMALAFAYLFNGDFANGLKHFEARFPYKLKNYLNFPYPMWKGEDISDGTLHVVAEQGMGDTLSFTRFIPAVAAKCEKIELQVQSELMRLVGAMVRPWGDKISMQPLPETFPKADRWVSTTSMPVALGLSTQQIVDAPGLAVPVSGLGSPNWKVPGRRLHVGIAWAGSPVNDIDPWRSCDVRMFLDLYKVPGIQLYGLQVGPHAQDIHAVGAAALIRDMSPYLRDCWDTVAVMRDLDLIITVETSVGHLAGSIDAECWTLNAFNGGDWRHGRKGNRPIWYPRTTIFRQGNDATWPPVFDRVVGALKRRVEG